MSKKPKNLVSLNHLPGILLASQAECERWIEAGLIPVAERRTIQRRGRSVEEPMFDPEVVVQLLAQVQAWRGQGDEVGSAQRSHGRRKDSDQSPDDAAHRRRQSILAPVRRNTGIYVAEDIRRIESGRWKPERVFAGYRAVFSQPMQVLPESEPIEIAIEFAFAEPVEVAAVALAPARVERTELAAASEALEGRLIELRDATFAACEQELAGWRDDLETYLDAFEDADERQAILGGIRAALDKLDRVHARHLREAQIREASGYERYAAIFPVARSLNRRFLFLAGPTNSGKTYEALKLAREAETAEILSPLRLLALEHFERMSEEGLPAGMVTGEERVLPEGATHIARTIETLDLHRVVDVCVIDEVQMLGDPSRGWAWTQAMVGAPARLVVLTGAPEAIPLVEHLLAMTGEPLEVKILKRKGRLRVEGVPANLNKLMRGDAVVAFTRRDVHDLRTRLVQSGRTVATVYGALGPEVRRAEAARFRNGEAEILVATDAIGMGLNIGPLRRVVFSTLRKYDGVRDRQLTAMEIKQIAGRAGRFGHHDEGLVTALPDVGGYAQVEKIIGQALTGDAGKLRGKAYVRPNQETVLSASEVLQTDRLGRVLQHLNDTLVAGHPDLRMADMDEMIELATLLDTVDMPILDRLSYSMAPVDGREKLAVELLLDWARQHARDGRVQGPDFGVNTDLLKLEARVKIATSWLWLAQRYPEVFEDLEDVVDLRASLNSKIEEKLVSTSVSHRRKPEDKVRRERGKASQKQRKNRRRRSETDADGMEPLQSRGQQASRKSR
ncbi:MAG: hypothetical protein K0Q60_1581 [Microvirga sp.]|nr:hypothetical protein [Microvirga sp.]